MEKLYKVVVKGGINSIPLTMEDALEYAFECNTDFEIVDLETGEIVDDSFEYAETEMDLHRYWRP